MATCFAPRGNFGNVFCSAARRSRKRSKIVFCPVVGKAFFEQVFDTLFAPLRSRRRVNQQKKHKIPLFFRYERLGRIFGAQPENNQTRNKNASEHRPEKARKQRSKKLLNLIRCGNKCQDLSKSGPKMPLKASRAQGRRQKAPKITLGSLRGPKNETWRSPAGIESFPRGGE